MKPTEAQSVSKSFPGFLEAGDLDGKEVTLTIASVREPVSDDKGKDGKPIGKPVVKFEKAAKEWVLNKTNARMIRQLYGNEYSGWKGKKITLYVTTCAAFGETVACTRVRRINPETGKVPELIITGNPFAAKEVSDV